MKTKSKIVKITDKELGKLKMEWYERGKRQSQKELREELAKVLGLYNIFEQLKEDF
jgi:hypothetical protein